MVGDLLEVSPGYAGLRICGNSLLSLKIQVCLCLWKIRGSCKNTLAFNSGRDMIFEQALQKKSTYKEEWWYGC